MSALHDYHALATLAAGLCPEAGIQLKIGDEWSYNPDRRELQVSQADIEDFGEDYCAAVVTHESAHAWISRYHYFLTPRPSFVVWRHVMNALEDPRVNIFAFDKLFPGSKSWFATLVEDEAEITAMLPTLPSFLQFAMVTAASDSLNWLIPSHPAPQTRAAFLALQETKAARSAYAYTLPPTHKVRIPDTRELRERYQSQITSVYPTLPPREIITPYEAVVRLSARDAFAIAEADILPIAFQLVSEDERQIAAHLSGHPDIAALMPEVVREKDGQTISLVVSKACQEPPYPDDHKLDAGLMDLARKAYEIFLNQRMNGPSGNGDEDRDGEGDSRASELRESRRSRRGRSTAHRRTRSPEPDDALIHNARSQVEQLTREIEDVLLPTQRLKRLNGFPSGNRVNMRRLVQFEATQQGYEDLWDRIEAPSRHNTVFGLLVDLSGSMQGDKIQAAVAGTILLAETLDRLRCRFAIHGFQDELIPFMDFGEPYTAGSTDRIKEMRLEVFADRLGGHNNPGHNDDGPCLAEFAHFVLAEQGAHWIVIVISDGEPAGCRSTPEDLRNTVADLGRNEPDLDLFGFGLGEGTDHVEEYYDNAIANVAPGDFAHEMGRLLKRVIVDGR